MKMLKTGSASKPCFAIVPENRNCYKTTGAERKNQE
jgi:hypothetical protein